MELAKLQRRAFAYRVGSALQYVCPSLGYHRVQYIPQGRRSQVQTGKPDLDIHCGAQHLCIHLYQDLLCLEEQVER